MHIQLSIKVLYRKKTPQAKKKTANMSARGTEGPGSPSVTNRTGLRTLGSMDFDAFFLKNPKWSRIQTFCGFVSIGLMVVKIIGKKGGLAYLYVYFLWGDVRGWGAEWHVELGYFGVLNSNLFEFWRSDWRFGRYGSKYRFKMGPKGPLCHFGSKNFFSSFRCKMVCYW